MTGFDKKTLILESSSDLVVTVEVDFDFNGWHKLMDVRLTAEKPFTYLFEKGFSVHWIRFKVDRAGTVSAHLVYD